MALVVSAALLCACAVWARAAVSVLRVPVDFESDYTVTVNNTVEYILEFTPNSEQAMWPARMFLSSTAADRARPVLITARQATGAQTWQLPYQEEEGGDLLLQLQRTLCFQVAQQSGVMTERFSVHISSASNESAAVRGRVDPARDWLLHLHTDTLVHATQTAPRVHHYRWAEGQSSARLVVASGDDTCAVIAIRNYTCPVAQGAQSAGVAAGLQMTVQRSGGAYLSRSQFPEGVFVVSVVLPSDTPCAGEPPPRPDWLYDAAVGLGGDVTTTPTTAPATPTTPTTPDRNKTLTLTVQAALTRGQYAVACVSTLAVFLAMYAGFLALLCARRYPPVRRLIGPRAVLADTRPPHDINKTIEEGPSTEIRQRRGSDATFDSVDDCSESDDEQPAEDECPRPHPHPRPVYTVPTAHTAPAPLANGDGAQPAVQEVPGEGGGEGGAVRAQAAPFGLPARLQVSALARRSERTLRARSDRYLHTLYTVAVFYALPVVQFVAAFQIVLNVSGSLDLCYYNFLCAHPAGALADFNHVFSNLGYLLLGALFMLQVRRRKLARKRRPRHPEYGIPAHYGLLSSLGAGMMVVAVLSASYHVCPNQLNFQFDTSFMYVLAVLSMVKMYQSRHPDINARAHATFAVLALLIAMVVWGVLGGGALFWGLFTVLHVFTFLLLSLRIYYVGQFRLDGASVGEAARGVAGLRGSGPLYAPRLLALWLANALNWALAIYGLVAMSADFASHLLFVLLGNTLVYLCFYLGMKLAHGERPRWYAWVHLGGAAAAWAPAMWLFVSGSSSWAATPAQSRHLNHPCRALAFYDSHDLWHLLSALALYLSFNLMLTWDDGLSAVPRTTIAVF